MQKFLIVVAAVFGLSISGAQAFSSNSDEGLRTNAVESRKAGIMNESSIKERIQQILASQNRQERNNNSESSVGAHSDDVRDWVKNLRHKRNSWGHKNRNESETADVSGQSAIKVAARAPVKSSLSTRDKINQVLGTLKKGGKKVTPGSVTRNPKVDSTPKPSPTKKPKASVTPKATATPKATTPASAPKADSNYPVKKGMATLFWVGEEAGSANGGITNVESAWDGNWSKSFGGVDDPDKRCGNNPCGFTPKENPFYFALPYNDLNSSGNRKSDAQQIPWFEEKKSRKSVVKNAWIEVTYNGKTTYGQWEDVGPFGEDDFNYVFGKAAVQTNTRIAGAGIDLSPAMYHALGMNDNANVSWRFVNDKDVPNGPWKDIVTTSDVKW